LDPHSRTGCFGEEKVSAPKEYIPNSLVGQATLGSLQTLGFVPIDADSHIIHKPRVELSRLAK